MRLMVLFIVLICSAPVWAAPKQTDPACGEFRYIQKTMKEINSRSVDEVIPHADWIERKYRRQDALAIGSNIARMVVLHLLNRLNVYMFLFPPSRAEAATLSGSFVRNPEAYSRFLQLSPDRACRILQLGGSDTELLRNVTHEVFREIRRAAH